MSDAAAPVDGERAGNRENVSAAILAAAIVSYAIALALHGIDEGEVWSAGLILFGLAMAAHTGFRNRPPRLGAQLSILVMLIVAAIDFAGGLRAAITGASNSSGAGLGLHGTVGVLALLSAVGWAAAAVRKHRLVRSAILASAGAAQLTLVLEIAGLPFRAAAMPQSFSMPAWILMLLLGAIGGSDLLRRAAALLDDRLRSPRATIGSRGWLAIWFGCGVGALTLLGWVQNSRLIVQAGTAMIPIPFNTGLAIMLSAVALGLGTCGRLRAAILAALPVVLIAGTNAYQELARRSVGIDELLWTHRIVAEGAIPGRMPLNTAIALLAIALGAGFAGRAWRRSSSWSVVWGLGLMVCLIAGMAALGYLLDVERLRNWGEYTAMAPLTAVGLGALGVAMISVGVGRTRTTIASGVLVPATVALSAMLISVLLWMGLSHNQFALQRNTDEAAAIALRNALESFLQVRIGFLEDLGHGLAQVDAAHRESLFDAQARRVLHSFPGLRSVLWVDTAGTIRHLQSIAPLNQFVGTPFAFDRERAELIAAAQRAGSAVFSGPLTLRDDGLGFVTIMRSMDSAGVVVGYYVVGIQYQPLLDALLRTTAPQYQVEIKDGQQLIYRRGESLSDMQAADMVAASARVMGRQWNLRAAPSVVGSLRPSLRMPEVVLFAGLITGSLLAMALRLAALARTRAESAESALKALREQTAARERAQLELDEQRSTNALILESITDAFITYDREWRIVRTNAQGEHLMQRSAAEVVGRNVWEVFPDAVGSLIYNEYHRAVRDNVSVSFEYGYEPLNLWLEVQAFPNPGGLSVFLRDRSAERAWLRRLQESEERLREAQELARIGTWECSLATADMRWSERALALLDLDIDSSRSSGGCERVAENVHPADRERVEQAHRSLQRDGLAFDIDYRVLERNGGVRHVQEAARLVRGTNGVPDRLLATVQDVTERRRAQQVMVERDRIFEMSQEMLAIVRDDRFEQVNPAFGSVLGYSSGELLAKPYIAFVHADDVAVVLAGFETARRTGRADDLTHRVLRADGTPRWIEWALTYGGEGVFYVVGRDITQRRQAQAQLEAAIESLNARNRELQDFAFIASHDLQEPLRKVQAFGDRLVGRYGEVLEAQGRDYVQRMRSAAARMQRLIDDLLSYSRISSRGDPFVQVDLDSLVTDVLGDLETSIEEAAAEIERSPLPSIRADRTQMGQVLQNLLGNALKFRAEGRPLKIRVRGEEYQRESKARKGESERWLRLQVIDNGIGFDNRFRERIFGPFQRLHDMASFGGTGIGLAIVRKIVQRHGGSVSAEGEPGRGAVFTVELPMDRTTTEGMDVILNDQTPDTATARTGAPNA